jgi:Tetratricopeptide repeat
LLGAERCRASRPAVLATVILAWRVVCRPTSPASIASDRCGLALTTASAAARDAYVQASGLALTFYPGALEAYEQAIAADPGFALAHAGKAQVLLRQGDVAAARAALAA